jgi:hypothetical protein
VTVEDAQVQPGQPYWRLVEVRWEDEQQAGGKHHIYVDVMDENGKRVQNQPVTVFWGEWQPHSGPGRQTCPRFWLQLSDVCCRVRLQRQGRRAPQRCAHGAGLGNLTKRFHGIHVAYYLTYQRAIR